MVMWKCVGMLFISFHQLFGKLWTSREKKTEILELGNMYEQHNFKEIFKGIWFLVIFVIKYNKYKKVFFLIFS